MVLGGITVNTSSSIFVINDRPDNTDQIIKYDSSGNASQVIDTGMYLGGIAVTDAYNDPWYNVNAVFVIDDRPYNTDRIIWYDNSGNVSKIIGTDRYLGGIAVSDSKEIFVISDRPNNTDQIIRYTSGGTVSEVIDTGMFLGGIAVSDSNQVFAINDDRPSNTDRIIWYDD